MKKALLIVAIAGICGFSAQACYRPYYWHRCWHSYRYYAPRAFYPYAVPAYYPAAYPVVAPVCYPAVYPAVYPAPVYYY
ncbi:MAG: hypothetical protein MJ016_03565 [Victivallaceae bacterium]|nr:hypothetical protein [Victivallaceae bacterium]